MRPRALQCERPLRSLALDARSTFDFFFFEPASEKKKPPCLPLREGDSRALFLFVLPPLPLSRRREQHSEQRQRAVPKTPFRAAHLVLVIIEKKMLQASHPIFRSPLVRQAWSVAKVAHRGQARSAAAPSQSLLEHCANVARAVAELLSGDAEAVAAAVLHEALGRGVATAGALAEVGVPDRVVALVSSVARMSDLCAVRRFTTGEASGSPSGSPVGSLAGGGIGGFASAATATAPAPLVPHAKADASAFVAMLLSMSDVRAVVIKLADRLCDLKSSAAAAVAEAEKHVDAPPSSSPSSSAAAKPSSLEARRAVADPAATTLPSAVAARDAARDALSLYAPLANRLGVWSLKAALEDAAFALLHPDEAEALAAALAPPERAAASLQHALDALRGTLDEVASSSGTAAKGLANADLSGRPKNLYGVYRKMLSKGPGATPASIHDARAVRVLVPAKADCYAALRAVHALWKPADEDQPFKDYIRRPKDNGYQSLHTVVLVADEETGELAPLEVQIRTAKMHLVAEFGVAAHWRYKEESSGVSASASEANEAALATAALAGATPTATANNEAASTSSFDADDAPLSSSDFEDAQVAWARWLITWAHELEDKKAKASEVAGAGSGPLAALAGAVGSAVPTVAAASASSSPHSHHNHHHQSSTCAFPAHSADCAFVDFMANTLNGRSSKKDKEGAAAAKAAASSSSVSSSPSSTVATASAVANVAASVPSSTERVLVAVLDHTGSGDGPAIPRVEAVPAGTTAAQLASRLAARASSGNGLVGAVGNGSHNSNGRPPSASSAAAYRASRVRTRVLVNNGELALSVQGGVATLEEDLELDGRSSWGDGAAAAAAERAAASLSAALRPGDKVELFFVPAGGPSSFDGSENSSRGGSIDVEVERVRLARLFSADVAARAATTSAV